tara:strand:- start:103 stop:351 length:249 start_codon:yes stop_codon:yes gene_type:complete
MAKRKTKTKVEQPRHFKVASEALRAVLSGYRQSEATWMDDVERANECIRMSFEKNDDVFEESEILINKYEFLNKKRSGKQDG